MDAAQYVKAQNGAVKLALRDLRTFWGQLDLRNGVSVRAVLEGFWPELLARYGEVTATLAADRFEELTGFSATMVRPVDPERANARMRWGIDPLFTGEGDAFGRLAGLVDELVKQPGRSTLVRSAQKNRVAYGRIPTGAETCDWCLMLAGRGFVYASADTAGEMRKFHADCVIEGTVVSGPAAVSATSRFYKGEVITIKAGVHEVTVTPNHPVLTARGWVGAQFVNECDYLFVSESVERIVGSGPDKHQGPARVEDRFAALSMRPETTRCRVPGTPEQFHGDGFESEVDIVARYDLLGNEPDSIVSEVGPELLFSGGAVACPGHSRALLADGSGQFASRRLFGSAYGVMGGTGLRQPLVDGHLPGAHLSGLAEASDLDPGLGQPSADNGPRNTFGTGDGILTFTGEISAYDTIRSLDAVATRRLVSNVSRSAYAGHVFNLSTETQWYMANSIVTHNCDCRIDVAP